MLKDKEVNVHIMLYVSFTCLPTRIANINLVLDSIQEQTLQPDKIIIHYPKKCLRLDQTYDVEELRSRVNKHNLNQKVYINVTNDYGPITKVYPLLGLDLLDDDFIVVIDDDNYYNKYLFEALYKNIIKEDSTCFCVSGLIYPTTLNSQYMCVRPGNFCHLMEAAFGFIIQKKNLQNDLEKWVIEAKSIDDVKDQHFMNSFLSDDYVFSRYLDTKQIRKKVIEFNPLVNKSNTFCSSECKSHDSLSSLELNLNKYVRSEIELKLRNLV